MLVHAYRRTKPIVLEFDPPLTFNPNEAGDIVCEVPEGPVLRRLLDEIPEAFKPYGEAEQKPADKPDGGGTSYILSSEGKPDLDLMTLDRAALVAFAAELGMQPFHHKTGEQKIRDAIVAHLKG